MRIDGKLEPLQSSMQIRQNNEWCEKDGSQRIGMRKIRGNRVFGKDSQTGRMPLV